jgi:hypothetical protein
MFAVKKPNRSSGRKIDIANNVDGKQYRSLQEYIAVHSAIQRMGRPQERLTHPAQWSLPTVNVHRSARLPQ